jgi:CBS-domain-containing membrane protein
MKAIYNGELIDGGVNAGRRRVAAVMSSPVRCIAVTATLGEALQTMVRVGLRHLAVVNDTGTFVGILSDRVIAAAWATDPTCLSATTVAMVIEAGPATVPDTAHVLDAARAMRAATTDAVAVLDGTGAVIGIITGSDMIAQLAR